MDLAQGTGRGLRPASRITNRVRMGYGYLFLVRRYSGVPVRWSEARYAGREALGLRTAS